MSSLIQTDPPRLAREALPTMYDLPSEEIGDPGMPDQFHVHQATLLDETFIPTSVPPDEVFSAMDMNLYFNPRRTDWYKRPDWFAVIGVSRLYEGRDSRLSYVTWQEEMNPLIVVELLSPKTEKEDLGRTLRDVNAPPAKWEVYERILRVPYYAVFGRKASELRVFRLSGLRYDEVTDHGGRFWITEAELGLGLWQGKYKGQERLWLRWYDAHGAWVLTPEERAEQERERAEQERWRAEQEYLRAEQEYQRAEQERQRAEQERQRAERLAEMLRQLGQDPNQL